MLHAPHKWSLCFVCTTPNALEYTICTNHKLPPSGGRCYATHTTLVDVAPELPVSHKCRWRSDRSQPARGHTHCWTPWWSTSGTSCSCEPSWPCALRWASPLLCMPDQEGGEREGREGGKYREKMCVSLLEGNRPHYVVKLHEGRVLAHTDVLLHPIRECLLHLLKQWTLYSAKHTYAKRLS